MENRGGTKLLKEEVGGARNLKNRKQAEQQKLGGAKESYGKVGDVKESSTNRWAEQRRVGT